MPFSSISPISPISAALLASASSQLADIHDICAANKTKLVFLTVFGANLYGTATRESDLDIRGIYVPADPQAQHHSIHIATNLTGDRNTSADTDIDLLSLQRWLQGLQEGTIAALDLLYAPTNENCTLYNDATLQPIFDAPLRYLNLQTAACQRYAIQQAKKYGCKGSKAGTLYAILSWLNQTPHAPDAPLLDYGGSIEVHCGVPGLCRFTRHNNEDFLFVCGKWHQASIHMDVFAQRIHKEAAPFMPAIENARRNRDVDYKALSHAVRAFLQMQEILTSGTLRFPLAFAGRIHAIKNGQYTWRELEPVIERLGEETSHMQQESPYANEFVPEMAQSFLHVLYGKDGR